MLINLDYIFQRDLTDEWVSQKTPLLDHDFFSAAVVDMDDNTDVAAPNEGDIAVYMHTDNDDYTHDEDDVQDDEETDGTMENAWRGGPVSRNVKGYNIMWCPIIMKIQ
ncbi:hypothetical protein AMTRI_Chr13g85680 [Amborella trichopoda]